MPGGGRHTSTSLSAFKPGGSSFTNKTRENFVMKNLHVDNTSTSTNKNTTNLKTTNLTATNVTTDKVTVNTLIKLPLIDRDEDGDLIAPTEEGLLGYEAQTGVTDSKLYFSKRTLAQGSLTETELVWQAVN